MAIDLMKTGYIVLLLIVFTSCRETVQQPELYSIGEEFELKVGETVVVGSERTPVTFTDVIEDSRCPINVTCIWAGNGLVKIRFLEQDVLLNTYLEPQEVQISNFSLKLINLLPDPEIPKEIKKDEYRVRLQILSE